MVDSGNEIECPPRGESPYLHASLWDIICTIIGLLFLASAELIYYHVLNWLFNSVTPQTHFEVQMRDQI